MIQEAKISSVVSLFPLPQYVIVLENIKRTHLVPIWIGISEGNAIALEMQGEKFPRPLTHDLVIDFLEALNAKVEKIVVSDLRDNSYFASVYLVHQGKTLEIDARPSDSLAIAVRAHCPIYIDEKVLKKCPKIETTISEDDIEKFKVELKTMSPEDFFKRLEDEPSAPEPGEGPQEDDEEGRADDPLS